MGKGASIKFQSYKETIPKILDLLNLKQEIKKYDKIVLKPSITNNPEDSTPIAMVEQVLRFCLDNKNPVAEVYIAEGADGYETTSLFDSVGYQKLAEHYEVNLLDLNDVETEEIEDGEFLKFASIKYPKILKDSFIISLSKLAENEETVIAGSLSNMLGAFPAAHYTGFFSEKKKKIRKWPIKYSVHDILKCKMPQFAVVDATEKGYILAGLPLEMDKQSAKLLGKNWKEIPYLALVNDSFLEGKETPSEEKSEQ
jgi:uncharacterized protein (DUF362 family)